MNKAIKTQRVKRGIKVKLIGSIIPVVLSMIVVLVMISYGISSREIKDISEELLNTSIKGQKNQIEAWLNKNLAEFEVVKSVLEAADTDEVALQAFMDRYYNYSANYPNGFYIGNADGTLIKASQVNKRVEDVTELQWYKEGLTRSSMAYGHAHVNELGQPVISASGILSDQSGKLRVLATELTLEKISIIVNSEIGMEAARAFLVDTQNGKILSHLDSEMILTTLDTSNTDPFLAQTAERIKQAQYEFSEIQGNYTSFEEIEGTDWVLVSYIPKAIVLDSVTKLKNILVLISIIAILVIIVLIERLVHFIILPIRRLTHVITEMASGDFTVEVESVGHNEVTVMSNSVKAFIHNMSAMIMEISSELGVQAHTSNMISKEMYDISSEQSVSMQSLNGTVDELVKSVTELANEATSLAMIVSDTKENGDKVKTKMADTVVTSVRGKEEISSVSKAMENILESINELKVAINNVGNVTEEVTGIANLIGNIAEETHLLSLNASIEAARAGESGKGFAVVASEIGKLASSSKDAVAEISTLITNINGLVTSAVQQAQGSAESINESSEFIQDAVSTFDTIYNTIQETETLVLEMIDKVNKVDGVAGEVAAISEEQAASAELILETSEAMVTKSNHISASSETVAKDAKKLTDISEELAEKMQVFKI